MWFPLIEIGGKICKPQAIRDRKVIMVLSILTFLFLYAVIWLFERKKQRVDPFRVGVAAIVPVGLMYIAGISAAIVLESSAAVIAFSSTILAAATFLTLWQVVGISPLRCVLYVFSVFAFQSLVGAAIFTLNPGATELTLYGDWQFP
jgi:hypothetical protein